MLKLSLVIRLIFILILTQSEIFSQNIKGKVTDKNGDPLSEVIVEFLNENRNIKFLTNEDGIFKINSKLIISDTISLNLFKPGFKTLHIKKNKSERLYIILLKDNVVRLEEVVITARETINKSNKTIYRIKSSDYKINAKADIALQTLPNIAVTGSGVLIDNRRKALIFVDGIESNIDELKRIDVKNVNKIEVISNPSLSYGSELLGGVIQVLTKRKKERYIKGEVETFLGLRLNSRGFIPSVSFKTKRITFNAFYSYTTNSQYINSAVERNNNNNYFKQDSYRAVNGWQDYLNSKMKISLSPKSFLNLSGNLFRYDLKSKTEGAYNNGIISNFNITSFEKLNKGFVF